MLFEEAKWIGQQLIELARPGDKLLNIGSSSLKFRTQIQPHIENYIFKPLKDNKVEIIHTDIIKEKGVDKVGDLTKRNFINMLKKDKYDLILCSNLLEHLEEKQPILDAIVQILHKGSTGIITVPYNYPYHLDPIDTMYRPSPSELHQLFFNTQLIKSEIVIGKSISSNIKYKNYWKKLKSRPFEIVKLFIRILIPIYKPKVWWFTLLSCKRMFSPFSASCIIIRK